MYILLFVIHKASFVLNAKNAVHKYTIPPPPLVCVRKGALHWFMEKMSAPLFVHHEDFLCPQSPK